MKTLIFIITIFGFKSLNAQKRKKLPKSLILKAFPKQQEHGAIEPIGGGFDSCL